MKLTRENYEVFFLDYYEGSLSKEQEDELFYFLQQNKDLQEEFQSFELISVADDTMAVFEDKDFLKRPFDTSVYNSIEQKHLIAYHEGDLNNEERELVLKAIAEDKKLEADFNLLGMSRLTPDYNIVYEDKRSLKKFVITGYLPYIRQFAAAAAVVALMATIYFNMPNLTDPVNIVEVKPETAITDSQTTESSEAEIVVPAVTNDTQVQESPSTPVPDKNSPAKTTPAVQPTQEPAKTNPPRRLPATGIQIFSRRNSDYAQMPPIIQAIPQGEAKPAEIEIKQEYYWLSYASLYEFAEEEKEETPAPAPRKYTSLASLAYNEIEKSTGIDIQSLADNKVGIWDLAGMGLAGIGSLTGNTLNINRERDENGRVTSFGIGDRFRINR